MSRNRKLRGEEHLKAVMEYLRGEGGYEIIAQRYGVSEVVIREDICRYKLQGPLAFNENGKNNHYSIEIKRKVVEAYLNGEGSQKVLAAKYGLRSSKQLRQWIKMYNSGRGFQRKMTGGSRMKKPRPTTVDERVQIAKDCIANGGNYGETALKYKVSYQQVYQWTKKFKEMGAAGLEDRRGKRKKDQTPRTELEKAQIEIERLKHELYMTQMERDLLKKLDEIERREAYRK